MARPRWATKIRVSGAAQSTGAAGSVPSSRVWRSCGVLPSRCQRMNDGVLPISLKLWGAALFQAAEPVIT